MKEFHLPLFDHYGQPCEFTGTRTGDELLDGALVADGREIGKVRRGIAAFPSAHDEREPSIQAFVEACRKGNWISHNWQNEQDCSQIPGRARLCDELSAIDGPILEIAAGPGGGNLSPILHRFPNASIVVNDILTPFLEIWQDQLVSMGVGPRVSFAAFDARLSPLSENSLSAISSNGGFSNIVGDKSQAVREAVRVLKLGGRLCISEGLLDIDELIRLPVELRDDYQLEMCLAKTGWGSLFEEAGLRIIWHDTTQGRALTPENDGVAVEAAKHGVTLHMRFEYVIAEKP
ncbi:MAG: methyltransferase domain-containing protein [Capsulimonadaceae bacterium]|nr:methyltransferase domain-containing protein [Capsulimonadaceae bacterium]